MRRWFHSTLCLWFVTTLLSSPATAEDGQATTDAKRADALLLDLSVPESPAFVVLGITPDKVTRPASPRELAAALQSGVDDSGNLQTGVAIDTVPYLVFFGDALTLGRYRENTVGKFSWRRLLARTQFSLATTKGTDQDDKSVRLALGFRATPWDEGDTRLDETLTNCIAGFQSTILRKMRDITPAVERDIRQKLALSEEQDIFQALQMRSKEDLEATLGPELFRKVWSLQDQQNWEAGVERCFTQAKRDNWNASAWDLGVAPSWLSADGSYSQLTSNGGTLWTSLALRLPEMDKTAPEAGALGYLRQRSQLLLHTRYRWDTMINQVDTQTFLEENDFLAGGRLRLGLEKLAVSAEGVYIRQKPKAQPATQGQRYAFSVDVRLTQGVWLHITGGTNEGVNGGSQGFAFGGLRYGLTQDSPAEAWDNL